MIDVVKRRRPRLNTTIGGWTLAVIHEVAKEKGLPNPGVTVDFIVKDWVTGQQAALLAARPAEPAGELSQALAHRSVAVVEPYRSVATPRPAVQPLEIVGMEHDRQE